MLRLGGYFDRPGHLIRSPRLHSRHRENAYMVQLSRRGSQPSQRCHPRRQATTRSSAAATGAPSRQDPNQPFRVRAEFRGVVFLDVMPLGLRFRTVSGSACRGCCDAVAGTAGRTIGGSDVVTACTTASPGGAHRRVCSPITAPSSPVNPRRPHRSGDHLGRTRHQLPPLPALPPRACRATSHWYVSRRPVVRCARTEPRR